MAASSLLIVVSTAIGGMSDAFDKDKWKSVTANFFGASSADVESMALSNPFCMDFDCDGDMDCLIGTFQGVTWYYERDSENNEWIKKSDHFFGESTGTEAAPWCGDLDGDGDADCLLGRADGRVVYYENTCDGSNECIEDWPAKGGRAFWKNRGAYVGADAEIWDVGSQCSPHCVDVDQDGDLDCFVGEDRGGTHFYENKLFENSKWKFGGELANYPGYGCLSGDNHWTKKDLSLQECQEACVAEAECNSIDWYDGVSLQGHTCSLSRSAKGKTSSTENCRHYGLDRDFKKKKGIDPNERNVCKQKHESDGQHTDKLVKTTSTFFKQSGNLQGNAVPRCGDYDKDGEVDCIVGYKSGYVGYYKGTGDGSFELETDNFFNKPFPVHAAVDCFDVDGDGDFDCLVGNFPKGSTVYQRNDKPLPSTSTATATTITTTKTTATTETSTTNTVLANLVDRLAAAEEKLLASGEGANSLEEALIKAEQALAEKLAQTNELVASLQISVLSLQAENKDLRGTVAGLLATTTRQPTTATEYAPFDDKCSRGLTEGCAPELVANGDGGVDIMACCGPVAIHSRDCSFDPCKIKEDIAAIKKQL